MNGRACERCGNFDVRSDGGGPFDGMESNDEETNERIPALCSEVQMAFGLLAWLCHDCRKAYFKMSKNHELTREYGEASLRLEFWKARIGENTPKSEVVEGLELWQMVDSLERKMNDFANEWLIIG